MPDSSLPELALSSVPKRPKGRRGSDLGRSDLAGPEKTGKAVQSPPVSEAGWQSTPSAKPPKYRNRRTNGYASVKEAKRAAELKLLEKAGKIRNLREQVCFELIPKQDGERAVKYVADFCYEITVNGVIWHSRVEDCKGFRTPSYVIKRKLMLQVHGIRLVET